MKDVSGFGWPTEPLGDLVDILDRLRKPITQSDRKAGPYPYYGATGVLDYVDGYLFDEPLVLIGEDGAKWEAGANSAFPIEGKVWVNNHAHVIRPHGGRVLDAWLIYYLNGSDLMPFVSGMTVPKLNQGRLREIPIPLPPLEEQQQIVAVLDEAFEGLARARAHAEANLRDARELYESELERTILRLEKNGLTRLSELIDITHGLAFDGADFDVSSDESLPIVLTPGNYSEDARLVFSAKNTKRLSASPPKSAVFLPGELTVVMTDLSSKMKILGKPAFIERGNILHNQRIGRVIFKTSVVDPRLLYHFLRSQKARGPIIDTATGTMVRHTAPKRILALEMPSPHSLEEQRAAVDFLDTIERDAIGLRESYNRKLKDIDALRQSLLQKAFAGELT